MENPYLQKASSPRYYHPRDKKSSDLFANLGKVLSTQADYGKRPVDDVERHRRLPPISFIDKSKDLSNLHGDEYRSELQNRLNQIRKSESPDKMRKKSSFNAQLEDTASPYYNKSPQFYSHPYNPIYKPHHVSKSHSGLQNQSEFSPRVNLMYPPQQPQPAVTTPYYVPYVAQLNHQMPPVQNTYPQHFQYGMPPPFRGGGEGLNQGFSPRIPGISPDKESLEYVKRQNKLIEKISKRLDRTPPSSRLRRDETHEQLLERMKGLEREAEMKAKISRYENMIEQAMQRRMKTPILRGRSDYKMQEELYSLKQESHYKDEVINFQAMLLQQMAHSFNQQYISSNMKHQTKYNQSLQASDESVSEEEEDNDYYNIKKISKKKYEARDNSKLKPKPHAKSRDPSQAPPSPQKGLERQHSVQTMKLKSLQSKISHNPTPSLPTIQQILDDEARSQEFTHKSRIISVNDISRRHSRHSTKASHKSKKNQNNDRHTSMRSMSGEDEVALKNFRVGLWGIVYPYLLRKEVVRRITDRKVQQYREFNQIATTAYEALKRWIYELSKPIFTKFVADPAKSYDFIGSPETGIPSFSDKKDRAGLIKEFIKNLFLSMTKGMDQTPLDPNSLEYLAMYSMGELYAVEGRYSTYEIMRLKFSENGRFIEFTKERAIMILLCTLGIRILVYEVIINLKNMGIGVELGDKLNRGLELIGAVVYRLILSYFTVEKLPIVNPDPSAVKAVIPLPPQEVRSNKPVEIKDDIKEENKNEAQDNTSPELINGLAPMTQLSLVLDDKKWAKTMNTVLTNWVEGICTQVERYRASVPAKAFLASGQDTRRAQTKAIVGPAI